MRRGRMVICIDFDGTIVDHKYPEIGSLKKGAREVINELFQKHEIVIFTCRSNSNSSKDDLHKAKKFLEMNGILFDEINENASDVTFGCWPKLYADIYIDDRSLFFVDDWDKIREELIRKGAL
jgi:predicted mannosyl-3-phosphoglycerate phosphatase (HAD superfamily)